MRKATVGDFVGVDVAAKKLDVHFHKRAEHFVVDLAFPELLNRLRGWIDNDKVSQDTALSNGWMEEEIALSFGENKTEDTLGRICGIEMHGRFNQDDTWFSDITGGASNSRAFDSFGQDGSGSLFCLWNKPGYADEERPVVFFGSEGELCVIAPDLATFAWFILCGSFASHPFTNISVDGVFST